MGIDLRTVRLDRIHLDRGADDLLLGLPQPTAARSAGGHTGGGTGVNRIVRRSLEIIAGLGGVGIVVLWLSGGFSPRIAPADVPAPAPSVPPGVREGIVVRETGPVFEWASGTVASATRTVVASRLLARIEEVRVRAGDTVAKGDVVVVLESQDIRARVAQARDALEAAEARLALARSEKARVEALFKKGVATRQRYDQALAELQAATAEVNRLKQSLREAETELSFTRIRAPVSGRVIDRLAEPGETATPGRPLLRIYDPDALRVEAPVRETLAVRLRLGQRLRIDIPALERTFEGTIEEIVPFAEPGARTLLVKVGLPPASGAVAGMFARIAVPAGKRTRLLMPVAALERVGQLEFVRVRDPAQGIERRLVTTGRYRDGDRIEVLSGLAEGEHVLVPSG
ncbi:MAG: efflux RND transporter periplasmic adaptor subunit [Alphaproteobacteria bacterium]|nr:MAG: efflux RND transporter periplasmic adaptor subunit [Alphaproteobacteria bacterium]